LVHEGWVRLVGVENPAYVEVAQILDSSLSTVKNYWAFARAWLLQEIKGV